MTTKQIDDGGPAFPNVWEDNPSPGMSLRDFHAAAALQGCVQGTFMASIILRMTGAELPQDAIPSEAEVAAVAYGYADAMLAERGG